LWDERYAFQQGVGSFSSRNNGWQEEWRYFVHPFDLL
jgi:hypothetical protein